MPSEQEPVFSMGTAAALKSLDELLSNKLEMIDTVCINVSTILRNCEANANVREAINDDKRKGIETNKPSLVLSEDTRNELYAIVEHLTALMTTNNVAINPVIFVYHTNYGQLIPAQLYRTPTHSKRVQTIADSMFVNKYFARTTSHVKRGAVDIIEIPVHNMWPWKHIANILKDIRNNHNVVMISSHPADYHLGMVSHAFKIIRSYTGDVIPSYKKANSFVFGTEIFPFNVYTHAVFGDKEDIKSSLQITNDSLVEMAEKEEWRYKTKEFIKDKFYKLGIRIPIELI